MATTGRTIVTDALMDLGVHGPGDDLDNDDLDLGLRRLNALVSSWNLETTNWGLPEFDADTDLSLPDGAELALVAHLALQLAAPFEAQVRPDIRERAFTAKQQVTRSAFVPTDLRTHTPFTSETYDITTDE